MHWNYDKIIKAWRILITFLADVLREKYNYI
jgi:hypothetical protein